MSELILILFFKTGNDKNALLTREAITIIFLAKLEFLGNNISTDIFKRIEWMMKYYHMMNRNETHMVQFHWLGKFRRGTLG